MYTSIIPEDFRQEIADTAMIKELIAYTRLRPSVVVVPWAVVLLDDPAVSIKRLAELITIDPILASRALRFANAAQSTLSSLTTTVDEALMRLGIEKVRGFLLASTFPFLQSSESESQLREEEELLWKTALVRAVLAREIVKVTRLANAEEVYTCALVTSSASFYRHRLPATLLSRIEENQKNTESLLALVLGVCEGWPREWIRAAAPAFSDASSVGNLSLLSSLHLAGLLVPEVMRDGAPVFEKPLLEAGEMLELGETALHRIVSSARKVVGEDLKRFGMSL